MIATVEQHRKIIINAARHQKNQKRKMLINFLRDGLNISKEKVKELKQLKEKF